MTFFRLIALVCAVCASGSEALGQVDPAPTVAEPVRMSLSHHGVEGLASISPTGPVVEFTQGGKRHRLELPLPFVDTVRSVARRGHWLVLDCGLKQYPRFAYLAVIDLRTVRATGGVGGYAAALSPTSAQAVLIRFTPLHYTADAEDQVTVVDLANVPAWPTDGSLPDPNAAAGPSLKTEPGMDAGREPVGVAPEHARRVLADPVWHADGRQLAFVERIGRGMPALVVVELGGGRPVVHRQSFLKDDLVPGERLDIDVSSPQPQVRARADRAGGPSLRVIGLSAAQGVEQ
jgi:hypothetical protein